jgi:hypothetical protein
MNEYGFSPPYQQNYPPTSRTSYTEQPYFTSEPYKSSHTPNPALLHDPKRPEHYLVRPPYETKPESLSHNTYRQPQFATRANSTLFAFTATGNYYSTSHSSITNQPLGSKGSTYPPYVVVLSISWLRSQAAVKTGTLPLPMDVHLVLLRHQLVTLSYSRHRQVPKFTP